MLTGYKRHRSTGNTARSMRPLGSALAGQLDYAARVSLWRALQVSKQPASPIGWSWMPRYVPVDDAND